MRGALKGLRKGKSPDALRPPETPAVAGYVIAFTTFPAEVCDGTACAGRWS